MKSLYYMTEFTRETIPIVEMTDASMLVFQELMRVMYEDGYSEPIDDAELITLDLVNTKLIIPVVVDESNWMSIKMALLDFHSCMMAGKFIVMSFDANIIEQMISHSFKWIGKGSLMIPDRRQCINAMKSVSDGYALAFMRELVHGGIG